MTELVWHEPVELKFETGVEKGVLYPSGGSAVVWNGLTSVEEISSGETQSHYLDGVKYLDRVIPGDCALNIKAYTYPTEFEELIGVKEAALGFDVYNQPTRSFGLSYQTRLGSSLLSTDFGYKLHIVYNAMANPDAVSFESLGESTSPAEFGWNIIATPVALAGFRPTAHFALDSSKIPPLLLKSIEEILYGSSSDAPRLPDPDELVTLLS
jgi:hypothetical protein